MKCRSAIASTEMLCELKAEYSVEDIRGVDGAGGRLKLLPSLPSHSPNKEMWVKVRPLFL